MRKTMRYLLASLTTLALAACPGRVPDNLVDDTPDAAPDAPPGDPTTRLGGRALDYFVANTPLGDTTVTTDGIEPPMSGTSTPDGEWLIEPIPAGIKVFLTASRSMYRPTRNLPATIGDEPVEQDVYLMSIADTNRQHTSINGLPMAAGTAFVATELRDLAGQPLAGAALADVTLVDLNDEPVPDVLGPYFFGITDIIIDPDALSEVHDGRARAAFLDVPPGTYKLRLSLPDGDGLVLAEATIVTDADGSTLAVVGGPVPGATNPDPAFAADIHPRLQKAALGGLGCAGCHTAGGSGAVLVMDGEPAAVLAAMQARPGVLALDPLLATESLLLSKPLYEPPPLPQNHTGGATFVDLDDPDYKLFLRWIANGLKP